MNTNKSIYTLEKNVIANSNFFYQKNHLDYNGWKSVKKLYIFFVWIASLHDMQ
jgi:hypothetical protein